MASKRSTSPFSHNVDNPWSSEPDNIYTNQRYPDRTYPDYTDPDNIYREDAYGAFSDSQYNPVDEYGAQGYDYNRGDVRPSLPIILFSAACGLGFGMIGLYLTYGVLRLNLQLSAGIATFFLLSSLGLTSVLLSILTNSKATLSNTGFSCGLVVLTLLFFGLCTLSGAIIATLIFALGGS